MHEVSESSLTPAELAAWAERGYFVRPSVFTIEECDAICARLSQRIEGAAREHAAGARGGLDFWELFARSDGGLEVMWDTSAGDPRGEPPERWERFAIRVGHALHLADEAFRTFCTDERIAGPLRALIEPPAVVVQTAVVYKQPGNQAVQFGFHQDASYLTTEPESLALAFVALDPMTEENGCLEVIPGSHLLGLETVFVLSKEGFAPSTDAASPARAGRDADRRGRATELLPMPRGSVALVHGRTQHASGWNRSTGPRRSLIVHAMSGRSRLMPSSWLHEPAGGFLPLPGARVDRPQGGR